MNAGQLLLSLRGRVNRVTYWLAMLPLGLACLYGWLLAGSADYRASTLGSIIVLVLIWPIFAVHVKRWHDLGKSGWWMLVTAIPVVGQFWTFVECGLVEGSVTSNIYGKPQSSLLEFDWVTKPDTDRQTQTDKEQAKEAASPIAPDLTSLMKMAGLIVRCQPNGGTAKIDSVRRYLANDAALDPSLVKHAMSQLESARFSTDSFRRNAQQFVGVHRADSEVLHTVADFLFEVAVVDGVLSAEKEILLSQAHAAFGFNGSAYSSYQSANDHRKQHQERQRQSSDSARGASIDKERLYGDVLGLHGEITPSEIKKAYRELVKQYHPDKVAHLGPKLRKTADLEMKMLNEAYEFFQKKYDF